MKNIAGHEVSLFLFRFEHRGRIISFVLNEGIAEDLYQDISVQLQPLVHACCETLSRYRHLCRTVTIMDGNLLLDGTFEAMLSPGMGRHFIEKEKMALFHDARTIARLLIEVMKRRDRERAQNLPPAPSGNKVDFSPEVISSGLEALGLRQHLDVSSPSSHLTPLSAADLPLGVVAKRSYDHRGYCIAFIHDMYGHLGRVVLFEESGETRMLSEVFNESDAQVSQKTALMETIVATIECRLNTSAGVRHH